MAVAFRSLMSKLRTVILLVLLLSHFLLGSGFFVSCLEQDGAQSTELALAVCCDTPREAPRAPEGSSIGESDDCTACVDGRLQPPAERPLGAGPALWIAPDSVVVSSVDIDLAVRASTLDLGSVPPDPSPRQLRPALLRS